MDGQKETHALAAADLDLSVPLRRDDRSLLVSLGRSVSRMLHIISTCGEVCSVHFDNDTLNSHAR